MKRHSSSDAVANLVGYIIITGVLMVLLVSVMILANDSLMVKPAERFTYHSYVDIGNGMSVRIVDVYTIAPPNGSIISDIDIPYDVLGEGYIISVQREGVDQEILIKGDRIETVISLAGIGATRAVRGTTTGGGLNRVIYDSGGV